MNRNEFRQRMNNYKKARASNPSLSYWEWKVNKYEKGTDEITDTTLPEVVVTPKRNYVNYPIDQDAYNSAMLEAWGKQTRIGPEEQRYLLNKSRQRQRMSGAITPMFDNNMINRIDDQVTQKQIKEAINKLPSELKSVKAAYQQFKSPKKYTKWFNTIPLLGTIPFIYNYSQEKDSN